MTKTWKIMYECETDLPTQKEYEVIKRLEDKYGEDNVELMGNFIKVMEDSREPLSAFEWLYHPIKRRNGYDSCFCGELLENGKIEMYPHSGGLPVKKKVGNQWVYVRCPKCDYCWSFQHLQYHEDRN